MGANEVLTEPNFPFSGSVGTFVDSAELCTASVSTR